MRVHNERKTILSIKTYRFNYFKGNETVALLAEKNNKI